MHSFTVTGCLHTGRHLLDIIAATVIPAANATSTSRHTTIQHAESKLTITCIPYISILYSSIGDDFAPGGEPTTTT